MDTPADFPSGHLSRRRGPASYLTGRRPFDRTPWLMPRPSGRTELAPNSTDRCIAALALPTPGSVAAEPAYHLADTATAGHLASGPARLAGHRDHGATDAAAHRRHRPRRLVLAMTTFCCRLRSWGGPADRSRKCPELLLCVRLPKLRPVFAA